MDIAFSYTTRPQGYLDIPDRVRGRVCHLTEMPVRALEVHYSRLAASWFTSQTELHFQLQSCRDVLELHRKNLHIQQ